MFFGLVKNVVRIKFGIRLIDYMAFHHEFIQIHVKLKVL